LEGRPVERGLSMLRALRSANDADDPARLPIGQRDARLLSLREQLFGDEITAIAHCPRCNEALEARFRTTSFRLPVKALPGTGSIEIDEYAVEFRLPDSLDLVALQGTTDEEQGLRRLLERCVVRALHRGEAVAAAEMPEAVTEAIAQAMEEADPQGAIELSLECVACRHKWDEVFDIESFLWNEIDAWATRTLHEVHQLAAAYGWNEREILTLSPVRRNIYLNLIAE
jgi:hypothetical protein